MTGGDQKDQQLARKGRILSLVIAGTMLLWLAAQVIGPAAGLPGRYALLFDFAAIAALVWALVNLIYIWRARRETQG